MRDCINHLAIAVYDRCEEVELTQADHDGHPCGSVLAPKAIVEAVLRPEIERLLGTCAKALEPGVYYVQVAHDCSGDALSAFEERRNRYLHSPVVEVPVTKHPEVVRAANILKVCNGLGYFLPRRIRDREFEPSYADLCVLLLKAKRDGSLGTRWFRWAMLVQTGMLYVHCLSRSLAAGLRWLIGVGLLFVLLKSILDRLN